MLENLSWIKLLKTKYKSNWWLPRYYSFLVFIGPVNLVYFAELLLFIMRLIFAAIGAYNTIYIINTCIHNMQENIESKQHIILGISTFPFKHDPNRKHTCIHILKHFDTIQLPHNLVQAHIIQQKLFFFFYKFLSCIPAQ